VTLEISCTACNINVTPGTLTATDTCIGYHVMRFEASLNIILHMRYVSSCVGTVCGRGRGTKINITDMHNNNTCDKYKSNLRHIHDLVLSSLKMKGIRLLFTRFSGLELDKSVSQSDRQSINQTNNLKHLTTNGP
jgi:hypothetical protein